MKKSLIALAVFGAFTGAAMAQGSNVQLYGLIDAGVTHYTGLSNGAGGTTSSTGLSSGVQSGDRIGLKGTEDLGGGLNAIFDVETGFCGTGTSQDVATAGGTPQTYCTGGGFMQRQSWVGLAGNFGTVMAGRQYTAQFDNEAAMDPFGFGLNGNIGNLSMVKHYGSYRADQVLSYVTPNLSGFTGVAAYVFAAGKGTVPTATQPNVSRAWTLNGQYGNGPITAGLNYTDVSNATSATAGGVATGAVKSWQLYGAYNFGVAKVSGIYEQAKQDFYSGNEKNWMIGLTVPVGPGAILASYDENKNSLALNGSAAPSGDTAKQYAIGYTYSLSKQTDLYASYAHISNGSGTDFAVGSSTDSFSGVAGQSSSGMAIGMRHMF